MNREFHERSAQALETIAQPKNATPGHTIVSVLLRAGYKITAFRELSVKNRIVLTHRVESQGLERDHVVAWFSMDEPMAPSRADVKWRKLAGDLARQHRTRAAQYEGFTAALKHDEGAPAA